MKWISREEAERIRNHRPKDCACVICQTHPRATAPVLVREEAPEGYPTGRYIGLSRGAYEQIKDLAR